MAAHVHTATHDGIDWPSRLTAMRLADEVAAPALRPVAERLLERIPAGATVIDVGSGAGGMSTELATALHRRGGGTVVLVDAVPELLHAADEATRAAAGDTVDVVTVQADLADSALADQVPRAQLVWASHVAHHLPDQRKAVENLVGLLANGGCLALAEGGLSMRCLPWDVGIGEPGLQDRVNAARDVWFAGMRANIPNVVSLPVGWNHVLTELGLADVSAFSYLVDRPAPLPEKLRPEVVNWLAWLASRAELQLSESDLNTVERLLDPTDDAYVGNRDDVFVLSASTVHLGWA
jgi:SAM-dependent methyltransferase